MKTVTFLNQKGGVGKTSCTHHLGGALALAGRRVLLIDADPQGSLTQGFLGPPAFHALDPAETVAAVLLGHDPFPEEVVRTSGVPGLDLMPGSKAAYDANTLNPWEQDPAVQRRLATVLAELAGRYDVCLVDCPPNFQGCAWAGLAASDGLVVPMQAEDYGAQGIGEVRDCLETVRAGINTRLRLTGYLITMYRPRAAIHKVYARNLREAYGRDVFDADFPDSLEYKEAIAARKPIGLYKPKGVAAKAVRALADELLARLDGAIESAATTTTVPLPDRPLAGGDEHGEAA